MCSANHQHKGITRFTLLVTALPSRPTAQVTAEVRDLDGRLDAVKKLLRKQGFCVTAEQQKTEEVGDARRRDASPSGSCAMTVSR